MTDHESPDRQLKPAFEKKNERLSIAGRISADRLKLFIECRIIPPPKDAESLPPLSVEDLLRLLDPIPRDMLHAEVLSDIVQQLNAGKAAEQRRIAKGKPPVNGRDGRLLLLVKKYTPRETKTEMLGERLAHSFDNVEKGTIVGRVYPPIDGVLGRDALGAVLQPTPGKPVKLALEKSVSLHAPAGGESFQTLVAEAAGYLSEENGKIAIVDHLMITGDVGYHTGDLTFVGAVTVTGDVLKDFHVTARGDIAIGGNCTDARIVSSQGSVTVAGTISGSTVTASAGKFDKVRNRPEMIYTNEGLSVQAAGRVAASCLQGVAVEAMNDVTVTKEIMGCVVHSRGALRIPTGSLLGGEIFVVKGLEAKTIGNISSVDTTIHLCSDTESTMEYTTLVHLVEQHKSAAEMLRLQLGPYESNRSRLQLVKEPYRGKLVKLAAKYDEVKVSLEKLLAQQRQLLGSGHGMETVQVNYGEVLHEGTAIVADAKKFVPKGDLRGPGSVVFSTKEREFAVTALRPLDPPKEATGVAASQPSTRK